jgi:hypothetical protein
VTVELYGECREHGYCDCDGVNGCSDPDAPGELPSPAELDKIRARERWYLSRNKNKTVGTQPLSGLKPGEPEKRALTIEKCPNCNYMKHEGDCPTLDSGSEFVQVMDRYFLQYWYETQEPSLRGFMAFVRQRDRNT